MNPDDREMAITRLLIKDRLRELAMNYCRAIDRRDPVLLASVFHEDAHDEHGTAFNGPIREFIASLDTIMAEFQVTQHSISNTSFRIDGDVAEGELYFDAYHRTVPPEPRHVLVRGRYLDRYERQAGEWRIAQRWLVWDSYETASVKPEDADALKALGAGGANADDYSYRRLGLLGRGC